MGASISRRVVSDRQRRPDALVKHNSRMPVVAHCRHNQLQRLVVVPHHNHTRSRRRHRPTTMVVGHQLRSLMKGCDDRRERCVHARPSSIICRQPELSRPLLLHRRRWHALDADLLKSRTNPKIERVCVLLLVIYYAVCVYRISGYVHFKKSLLK
jgi:hypothetical protein